MNYLFTEQEDGYISILRIESETVSHVTVTNPLFKCFGQVFSRFGKERTITKKWLESRRFKKVDSNTALKLDGLVGGSTTSDVYDNIINQIKI